MRRLLVLCTALMTSACGYGPGAHPMLMETQAVEVDAAKAIVLPPPGGPRVISVIQTNYDNALMQQIVLGGDSRAIGENAITVRLYGPVGGVTGNTLSQDRPTLTTIGREMVKAFPSVRMQVSSYYTQNFYGPFGYAVGKTAGGTCLYGWQLIEPPKNRLLEPSSLGRVTLRVRLCETGATEESLLAYMYGLSVNTYFVAPNWNPYGPVPAVSGSLGGVGAPSLPVPPGSNPYYSSAPADPRLGRVLPAASPAPAKGSVRRSAATGAAAAPAAPAGPPPVLQNPSVLPGLDNGTSSPGGSSSAPSSGTSSDANGTGGAAIPQPAASSGGPAVVPLPSGTTSGSVDGPTGTVRVVGSSATDAVSATSAAPSVTVPLPGQAASPSTTQ
ncbi:cellulose biosynthesis protein BcsN [Segnochrobactrum spirostomi]|nr:cellulose biosynthesis protein BcsN [Segnochrobactrum spirostomi]